MVNKKSTEDSHVFDKAWADLGRFGGSTALLIVDVEKVDYVNSKVLITQLGVRTIANDNGDMPDRTMLYLVSQNKKYKNRFCTAVRHDNFAFAKQRGDLQVIPRQRDLGHCFAKHLAGIQSRYKQVIIAGWDVGHDIKWLADGANWAVPANVSVVDLQAVWMATYNIPRGCKPSLGNALLSAEIRHEREHMHNGGNDAHDTGEIASHLGGIRQFPNRLAATSKQSN